MVAVIVAAVTTTLVVSTVAGLVFTNALDKRRKLPDRERLMDDARLLERRASSDITLQPTERTKLLDHATRLREMAWALPHQEDDDDAFTSSVDR